MMHPSSVKAHTRSSLPRSPLLRPEDCWTHNGANICEHVVGADSSQCYDSSCQCENAHSRQPHRLSSINNLCQSLWEESFRPAVQILPKFHHPELRFFSDTVTQRSWVFELGCSFLIFYYSPYFSENASLASPSKSASLPTDGREPRVAAMVRVL